MKFNILFKFACFCYLIGYIKADDKTEHFENTTVPSTVLSNSNDTNLNDTNSNDTNSSTTLTGTSTEITETITVKATTEEMATSVVTNSTEISTPSNSTTSSVNTGKTTLTTDLSTGEKNPTAAPSKAGSGGFNALSFIGGIVFTVGFLAIMYVGFKFYKSRTERNYHTL